GEPRPIVLYHLFLFFVIISDCRRTPSKGVVGIVEPLFGGQEMSKIIDDPGFLFDDLIVYGLYFSVSIAEGKPSPAPLFPLYPEFLHARGRTAFLFDLHGPFGLPFQIYTIAFMIDQQLGLDIQGKDITRTSDLLV